MEKWDLLNLILREKNLCELLDTMYKNIDKTRNRADTIRDTAIQWKNKNPNVNNEIVEQIVENI